MARRVYDTIQWKRVRKLKLAEQPLCEHCEAVGVVRPATDVDHVVSIEDGGAAFDMNNLASLCHSCHSRKTARENRGFGNERSKRPMKGCDANGLPLDPSHPWHRGRGH